MLQASARPFNERITTLVAYTHFAYGQTLIFIELSPFAGFREDYLTDEDLMRLQRTLLSAPDAGDLIRGGSGLRKIRWPASGRGKRGGARVIYYWHVDRHSIYLVYGYLKNERDELTPRQIKTLARLLKD